MHPLRLLLAPFALVYGLVIALRNVCYGTGIFHSYTFPVTTFVIGNLSTGGTGKTPHTEYLVRLLQDELQVATLSRGYKRTSKGYQLAESTSTHEEIGDEPRQFKTKFPNIPVAVDANRVRGIRKLLETYPGLDAIILDDAYQHRAVRPEVAILLTPYSDLYIDDYMLPTGNLREPRSASSRADIIIVTKCPEILSPLERRSIRDELRPRSHQTVYFSYFRYKAFAPANPRDHPRWDASDVDHVYLFTGIATPGPLMDYLDSEKIEYQHARFPDHHPYTTQDIERICKEFDTFRLSHKNALLLTTEKDLMRIQGTPLEDFFRTVPLYYLPIEVAFHGEDGKEFDEQILQYVKRNQVHRNLHQREA